MNDVSLMFHTVRMSGFGQLTGKSQGGRGKVTRFPSRNMKLGDISAAVDFRKLFLKPFVSHSFLRKSLFAEAPQKLY